MQQRPEYGIDGPLAVTALVSAPADYAQDQTPPANQQPKQTDQTTPDAGGPNGDTGVIAVPKKKDNPDEEPPAPAAPPEPKVKNPENMGNVSLHIDVPEVTVDVGVLLEKTGQHDKYDNQNRPAPPASSRIPGRHRRA